ncbi:MAG TPA: hypothetical protein DCQ32_11140 [Cyanobacteria bacterium UBA8156]|jgi:hypothetical protein|nr:hypothetical protein [Cyanobacteria bacterium UBA8156]
MIGKPLGKVLLCTLLVLTWVWMPRAEALTFAGLDQGAAIATIRQECGGTDLVCLGHKLEEFTAAGGPVAAFEVLNRAIATKAVVAQDDFHEMAHHIGRATARTFGVNPEAFAACPDSFNYGCQHGFFQAALAEEPDLVATSRKICDSGQSTQSRAEFYCFHGVGHGVMMAKMYDLEASLAVCDRLEGSRAEGCWQGVFMENINGETNGMGQAGVFADDPLAPCNTVDRRYRYQCYINHASHLLRRSGMSVAAASRLCLRAEEHLKPCLESIGIMATNPGWQTAVVGAGGSFYDKALRICQEFPADLRHYCIGSGVDNLAANYTTDIETSVQFCRRVPQSDRAFCFGRIGASIADKLPVGDDGSQACVGVPKAYRPDCEAGLHRYYAYRSKATG